MTNKRNSQSVTVFHAEPLPETKAKPVGYIALIADYDLSVPLPDLLCAIGEKHKKYEKGRWRVFTPRHAPEDTLCGHLTFALKYEGIELGVLKALFDHIAPALLVDIVQSEPTGIYSRRIWFLFEWLRNENLDLPDATQGDFVALVNDKLQYPGPSRPSRRHRVHNNLPGTCDFCPLIRRTDKLDRCIALNLSQTAVDHIGKTHPDLLSRAAAFLLLRDSKASYTIEGESPPYNRIERWGKIIGQAGQRPLNLEELEHLQKIVIADNRFMMPGCRIEGGFVGEHDRVTGMPRPVHISARADDLGKLLSGFFETYSLLNESDYNPVLMAALIAFGFIFIHPFEDGNGRIHRYLFHHILAEKKFVPKGLVFPISAVILERIESYKSTLEACSKPRLEHIQWRPTDRNNVEVLNDTIDLYRYFDATKQAEFFYACVEETVNTALPEEVRYLEKYDLLNDFIKNYIDMPDKLVNLLIRFLNQNNGLLSKRARKKEFAQLTDDEVSAIERKYDDIFKGNS
ncbi:MAG: Fic family protein [Gammaproteobacteria bacterium]|nr:Fic family protein [Gammaproteobacteria bacterium]